MISLQMYFFSGMQQLHCILPFGGGQFQYQTRITTHIQGVLNHGRSLTFNITFPNVVRSKKTCLLKIVVFNHVFILLDFNLSIHSWLTDLEDVFKAQGRLPDVLYHQIDGGSENTSKSYLGYCELLVARGLTKKVVLTRYV